jgi:F-type H+-transporting ATPase subunit epsilon
MKKLHLLVVSQEKRLIDEQVSSITAPASEGEITILPDHIPLFTPLSPGELIYRIDKEELSLVVSKGFIDVGPDSTVTIMVDSATHARDISVQKAEEAIQRAKETIVQSKDQRELMLAEASLKLALLEIKVAQRTKKTTL